MLIYVENYRPISILPLLSKVYERPIANRMVKLILKYSLVTPCQFGFRKAKSTQDAICALTDHIYDKMNAKQHSVAIFLDLCKAYDTVNHSILLSKLYQYGFRSATLNWFRSYLSNKQHFVEGVILYLRKNYQYIYSSWFDLGLQPFFHCIFQIFP